MRKKFWINLALLLVIPGLLFTVSCAKKSVRSDTMAAGTTGGDTSGKMAQDDDAAAARKRAMEDAKLAQMRKEMEARQQFTNEDVYFEFDSSALLADAQAVLKRKAGWLKANSGASVVVEGHCDERGTSEYNLALGDRRAESAKKFLVDLGIDGRRITTISYGEERPMDTGKNEMSWAKNRRAHFVPK